MIWRAERLVWFNGQQCWVLLGGCAGANERDRPGCHHPLLPLSPPGGPRGLRDNRQGFNDKRNILMLGIDRNIY
jgi:hypothetical protein